MNKEFGCQDMTSTIRRVLIKSPESAYKNQVNIDSQYQDLNYFGRPDFVRSIKDYESFRSILKKNGVEILCYRTEISPEAIQIHVPVEIEIS